MTTFSPTTAIFFPTVDWTLEQYHRMVETGILGENDSVELLSGKIVPMSPVGRFHAACVSRIQEFFIVNFAGKYVFRTQDPISLLPDSEPEPDFVVADLREDDYASGHPTGSEIVLLVEVADSTLDKDRQGKLGIYARSAVSEYWLVNLPERCIHVFTTPRVDGTYAAESIAEEGETLEHPRWGAVEVQRLLPPVVPKRGKP